MGLMLPNFMAVDWRYMADLAREDGFVRLAEVYEEKADQAEREDKLA